MAKTCNGVVCLAARYDGVTCADDECDIAEGVRSIPVDSGDELRRILGEALEKMRQRKDMADELRPDPDTLNKPMTI